MDNIRASPRANSRRRIAQNPDFQPLLIRSPQELLDASGRSAHLNETGMTRADVPLYHSLQPMRVAGTASGARRTSQDVHEDESVPLLDISPSMFNDSFASPKQNAAGVQFHLPNLKAATQLHGQRGQRRQRARILDAQRAISGLGVARHSNPATDFAGFCSHGCCCIQCIRTNEIGVLQTFGQFQEMLQPGLVVMAWPCTNVAGRLSLRIQQLDIVCETKTRDHVFVNAKVSIQFRVIKEQAYDAFYRLANVQKQVRAYVFDAIRSTIPRMETDDLFVSKSDIALDVHRCLQGVMQHFGYEIVNTLLTDISPNPLVKASMNEINASKRIKESMSYKAEAEKTMKVKAAEANAEKLHLEGIGVAKQRRAIAHGMKQSVAEFVDEKITPKHVMDMLLVSHYYDTLYSIGSGNMFVLHSPSEVQVLKEQISAYFLPSSAVETDEGIPDLLW